MFVDFIKRTVAYYKFLKEKTLFIINQNRYFLSNGTYRSNGTNSVIYNTKEKHRAINEKKFIWRENCKKSIAKNKGYTRDKTLALWLFSKLFKIKITGAESGKGAYNCQVIILSTLGEDLKFISYRDNCIYTKFRSSERMQKVLDNRNLWAEFGTCVPVSEINRDLLFVKERLINKIVYDHVKGFEYVLNSVTDFFRKDMIRADSFDCSPEYILKAEEYIKSFRSADADELLKNFRQFISDGDYKKSLCHGDTYYNNLLFDGKTFYYIDFEMVGKRFFIFDVLFYMFFESFRWSDDRLIDDYLKGVYDKELKTIFDKAGVCYDVNLRKTYLFVALFEYYGVKIPIKFANKFLFGIDDSLLSRLKLKR